jgi:hypothetical protein
MAITVFSDVVLPNSIISSGVRGKNIRRNDRVQTDSGQQAINIGWTSTLRQFEIGIVPMRVEQWQAIETLHEITEGGAYGFLMEDPKDSIVANGIVKDEGGKLYLFKRYTEARSGRMKDRKITRPRLDTITTSAGTPVLAADGSVTGIAADATWSGRFYVPVHFVDDSIDWDLVAPGGIDTRFLAGPSVMLQEIRE